MTNVVCFKTIVGVEIVSELIETLENGDVIVKRPYSLTILGADERGNVQLQMMPFFLMNPEHHITLKSSFLGSLPYEAPSGLHDEYLSQSSGLLLN